MTQTERNLLISLARLAVAQGASSHPQPGSLWDQIQIGLAKLRKEEAAQRLADQAQLMREYEAKLTTMGDAT